MVAAWKALYEVVVNPFYWDKTQHGVDGTEETVVEEPAEALLPLIQLGSGAGTTSTEVGSGPVPATRVGETLPSCSLSVQGTVS